MIGRVEKIKKAQKIVAAYKAVFSSDNGKIVLLDLAKKCHFMTPVTAENGIFSAFNDGKRCAVIDILKMAGYDETVLIDLLQQEGN